ncbi:transporter, small conductance mechanosensitive ion channel MscS family protein [Clostridiales bacterium KLE1615]|nr:transporter, small conductance mechanosensitive ion channel MscS family protein [Clostridiales bacterium KLE1615]
MLAAGKEKTMKCFNWFNDLSSILTLDLATAAVEETEPESMEFLANELGDKVEKLSQISWKEMFERYVPVVCDYLLRIALVLVIFFVGRKLIKNIVSLCDQALKRHGMEVTVRRFFCNVINALGYICMLGILLQTVGLTATSLTALVASAGVAVGLALQGSLSNFAGGVLILLMKPFVIGDYIVQGNTEGTVKEIGLVYTELITADNRLIVIPNGTLIDSSIVNVTATGKRRLELSVGIGYKSDLKKAKEVLIRLGENDPARDLENPVNVFVSELAESSVNLGLHVWVSSSEYWNAKWRLTENIKMAFDEEGIEIPFKQVEISVTKM